MKLFLHYVVLLTFISCGPKVIYESYLTLDKKWSYQDSLIFKYTIEDTLLPYTMFLNLKHDATFGFENIYLSASTVFPDEKRTSSPFSVQLANSSGEWLGDCNGVCNHGVEISSHSFYKRKGNYSLILKQFSRKDSLDGIKEIALKIVVADVIK